MACSESYGTALRKHPCTSVYMEHGVGDTSTAELEEQQPHVKLRCLASCTDKALCMCRSAPALGNGGRLAFIFLLEAFLAADQRGD